MAKESSSASGGIGLSSGIFLVFLILKLAEIGAVAKWSWWWVTSPLWIPVLILAAIFIVMGMGWGALKLYNSTINKKRYDKAMQQINELKERNKKPVSSWQKKLEEMQARKN